MKLAITQPAIRVKITGNCNRTCNFCHEEGDMRSISPVYIDQEFFDCINGLCDALHINRVMLSGGEPTVHPRLNEIISALAGYDISVTTNGIKLIDQTTWEVYKRSGLKKVIISMHDAEAEQLVKLETRPRSLDWGEVSMANQLANLENVCRAGLAARINTVVYNGPDNALAVVKRLESLLKQGLQFEVRLLNDLGNTEQSHRDIDEVCRQYGGEQDGAYRRAGTSNLTRYLKTPTGIRLSTKISFPYFFGPVCDGCDIKDSCMEGFYGLRVEKRQKEYYVRLCIYKHTPDVLMPWRNFLASRLPEQIQTGTTDELFD